MKLARHYARSDIRIQPSSRGAINICCAPLPLLRRNLRAEIMQALGKLWKDRFGKSQAFRLRRRRWALARIHEQIMDRYVDAEFRGCCHRIRLSKYFEGSR